MTLPTSARDALLLVTRVIVGVVLVATAHRSSSPTASEAPPTPSPRWASRSRRPPPCSPRSSSWSAVPRSCSARPRSWPARSSSSTCSRVPTRPHRQWRVRHRQWLRTGRGDRRCSPCCWSPSVRAGSASTTPSPADGLQPSTARDGRLAQTERGPEAARVSEAASPSSSAAPSADGRSGSLPPAQRPCRTRARLESQNQYSASIARCPRSQRPAGRGRPAAR